MHKQSKQIELNEEATFLKLHKTKLTINRSIQITRRKKQTQNYKKTKHQNINQNTTNKKQKAQKQKGLRASLPKCCKNTLTYILIKTLQRHYKD